uniref:COA3 factor n=1 Tax=Catharus ustulatus TaxID=91951 RepID=A0A8C3UKZ2_CATUS
RRSGGTGDPIQRVRPEAAFARRIDPSREPGLSPEQRRLMAQVEYAQRQRALQRRLRSRNVLLALGIGAVTFGICILGGRTRPGALRDRGREGSGGDSGPRPQLFLNSPHRRLHLLLGVAGAVPG